jgi:hypothetical protein
LCMWQANWMTRRIQANSCNGSDVVLHSSSLGSDHSRSMSIDPRVAIEEPEIPNSLPSS